MSLNNSNSAKHIYGQFNVKMPENICVNINIPVRRTSEFHQKHFAANIMVLRTFLVFSIYETWRISVEIYLFTNIMVRRTSVFHTKHISTIMMVLRTLLVYSIQLNSKLFVKIFGLFKAAELQNICRDA
jgi:hypothetical protein